MASVVFEIWVATGLITLGIYNLISTTRNYLKSPLSYTAKPFHPLNHTNTHLKQTPLYLLIISLFISFLHQTLIDNSLHSALLLLLFLLLPVSALFSSLPSDLLFASASAFFFLHHSSASQTSDLESKIHSVSASISAFSSLLCLLLAVNSRLFAADVGFAASFVLQGLWAFQRGLSLSVDEFIPEGCHKLLESGGTKCDLEESKLRAFAILDFVFLVYVLFVVVVVMICYGVVAKSVGITRPASYEALPTSTAVSDSNHIQMKAFAGTQA